MSHRENWTTIWRLVPYYPQSCVSDIPARLTLGLAPGFPMNPLASACENQFAPWETREKFDSPLISLPN